MSYIAAEDVAKAKEMDLLTYLLIIPGLWPTPAAV